MKPLAPIGRRGFSLVEAVMAMLITSVILVAAMRAASGAALIRDKSSDRVTGQKLADGLLNDILALSYQDPLVTPVFGRESGESSTSKIAWNDVDDFNGWTETPPQERNGNAMTDLAGWKRTVLVERVSATDGYTVSSSESGAKRITVTVSHNNQLVCTRVGLRTSAP